jgi:hypothetical protein
LNIGHSKSTVIGNVWLYSRYYGNQLAFLREVEGNGSAALVYLLNLLENILKSNLSDYESSFQDVVKKLLTSGAINKIEHDFLNNKKTGIRKLRNIFAHANLSQFNVKFKGNETLYPLTENDNCQLLYSKLSDVIFNIIMKVAIIPLNVDLTVNVDCAINLLKYEIITFTPEDILIDKGIDPKTLDGWFDLNLSERYRQAENAQNVKVLAHIFSGLVEL